MVQAAVAISQIWSFPDDPGGCRMVSNVAVLRFVSRVTVFGISG